MEKQIISNCALSENYVIHNCERLIYSLQEKRLCKFTLIASEESPVKTGLSQFLICAATTICLSRRSCSIFSMQYVLKTIVNTVLKKLEMSHLSVRERFLKDHV